MAQIIVRDLEDGILDKIRALAARNGRSMEEEVREMLRAAVLTVTRQPQGLGTRLVERFQESQLEEGEIGELRGHLPRPAEFED